MDGNKQAASEVAKTRRYRSSVGQHSRFIRGSSVSVGFRVVLRQSAHTHSTAAGVAVGRRRGDEVT